MTLVRLGVTKRRLLEWETAAATTARSTGLVGGRGLRPLRRRDDGQSDRGGRRLAAGRRRTARCARRRGADSDVVVSRQPGLTGSACRPASGSGRSADDERALLRRTARRTWRYFEVFVTKADGWLPPDNYQERGAEPRLARRTSPTNIGMALLSTLAAHDLGYLSTRDLVDRLDRTLGALESLERYEGHFLNWYDTSTLAPLRPHYVSTVDSGNLAGALIALAQGLTALIDTPGPIERHVEGLIDTADVLAECAARQSADDGGRGQRVGRNRGPPRGGRAPDPRSGRRDSPR